MAMKFYLFLNRFRSTSAVRKQFSYPDFPGEFEAASTRKCPFVKRASSNTPCPLNL